ncbi:SOS response-associated peptidase family protein [uncultured Ruminococcus sp.]|uniref:SOS response-associated peptidase family protein n=1 Tax=uncultured Ruminococcus sp. TaxID=165186 RepID=UPI0025ED4278|nr:SOS response-associated peptidase family protein [uncultured Ruminococcus sp.]
MIKAARNGQLFFLSIDEAFYKAAGTVMDIHDRMPVILDKENVKEWIRPDGDPGIIVEKALSNMAFEKAVEYHRSPMEFITV